MCYPRCIKGKMCYPSFKNQYPLLIRFLCPVFSKETMPFSLFHTKRKKDKDLLIEIKIIFSHLDWIECIIVAKTIYTLRNG